MASTDADVKVVEEAPGPASNGGAPHAERSAALQREGSAPSSVHAEPSNEDDEAEAAAKPNATQPKAVKAAAAAAEEEEEAAEAAAAKEAAVDGGDADAEAADDEDGGTAAGAKAAGGDAAEKQQQKPDGASPARTGAVAARARMAAQNPNAELVRASDPLDEVRSSPVRITDLSKQLKEQFESGGSGGSGGGGAGSDGGKDGNMSARSASAAALTQHDLVNTANVALVLQAGEFKLRPGIDVVPYDDLKELRLEDGLDVSRKEEYLSDAEFETVFGTDKETFLAMPAWKRINAKKAKGLF